MSLLDQSRGAEGSSHLDDLDALEQVAALHPDAAGMSRIAAYLAPTVQHFVSLPSVASRQSSEPSDN